jgi:excisionase family DNA binding protein
MQDRIISSDDQQSPDRRVHESPPGTTALRGSSPGAVCGDVVCGDEREGDGPAAGSRRTSSVAALDDDYQRHAGDDADACSSAASGEPSGLEGSAVTRRQPSGPRPSTLKEILDLPLFAPETLDAFVAFVRGIEDRADVAERRVGILVDGLGSHPPPESPAPHDPDQCVTVRAAAALLAVDEKTIARAIDDGELPVVRVRGTVRVPRSALRPRIKIDGGSNEMGEPMANGSVGGAGGAARLGAAKRRVRRKGKGDRPAHSPRTDATAGVPGGRDEGRRAEVDRGADRGGKGRPAGRDEKVADALRNIRGVRTGSPDGER